MTSRRSPYIHVRDPDRGLKDWLTELAAARTTPGRPPTTASDIVRELLRDARTTRTALCDTTGHTPGHTGTCTQCGTPTGAP